MNTNGPFFSIIIPTLNRAPLLDRALETVFDQTFEDYEVVVVDDGSTDSTSEVLERYNGRIRVIQSDHQGAPKARNLAIGNASGKYTVFLDDDDLFFPWTLENLRQAVERHGFPALLVSRILFFEQDHELAEVTPAPLRTEVWKDYLEGTAAGYWITLPCTAMRSDLLKGLGGFWHEFLLGEEHDLFLRGGTAEGFVFIDSPPMFGYRQHPVTFSRNMKRLYDGTRFLMEREEKGLYPGGEARRRERSLALSYVVDYAVKRNFRAGKYGYGYALCAQGAKYLVRSGRWKDAFLHLPFQPFRRLWKRSRKRAARWYRSWVPSQGTTPPVNRG